MGYYNIQVWIKKITDPRLGDLGLKINSFQILYESTKKKYIAMYILNNIVTKNNPPLFTYAIILLQMLTTFENITLMTQSH